MRESKPKHLYVTIEDSYICNGHKITSYGISVFSSEYNHIQMIHRISEDYTSISNLVELCNSLQLDPIHLYDVVDDFLYDINWKQNT